MEDLSGRPLLDTEPDHALFGGREAELSDLITSVERRENVLVTGDRGSGKTTLLRQLAFELRAGKPNEPPPVFVEGFLADDARTFLDLVRYRFGAEPLIREPSPIQQSFVRLSMQGKAAITDTLQLPNLVSSLREATRGRQRVVLVDELPSAAVGQTIFGRLRDELWQIPITWVVAVSEEYAGTLLSPPADAFFGVVLRLRPLTKDQQASLLHARAGAKGRNLAREIDEGNPRRLIKLASETVGGRGNPKAMSQSQRDRDARVSKLGAPAAMLVSELESLGPVSASDEDLLRRLGWTRSRATQVFKELQNAGVVTSSSVKGETGRPRKVYRLTDPSRESPRDGEDAP
jgi:energy-coupling factor transporter ATP-binding protein EcfA2